MRIPTCSKSASRGLATGLSARSQEGLQERRLNLSYGLIKESADTGEDVVGFAGEAQAADGRLARMVDDYAIVALIAYGGAVVHTFFM